MVNVNELKFDGSGLIPAIVVDADDGSVLTLAYMNRESLEITMGEGRTCFWSRSRGELWRKGETSGNVQRIVNIKADCDRDALTVYVKKAGPACHLGPESCFNDDVYVGADGPKFSLGELNGLILDRKAEPKPGSYTTYLFDKGIDKILKKVGEECTEVIIAGKGGDRAELVYEISDLAYHVLVLMAEAGVTTGDVLGELASRHIIDHKVKQEKMTT